tara:strand:+ start:875 stop:1282 length:408 start_codon:yes stop_codon:yes gene_type:complete
MDLDKALYMSEFLKIREDLGTTEIYPVTNTLYSNLYGEFKQKEKIEEVKEIIEGIEDITEDITENKTIHLAKKEDQPVFFPDLPELIDDKLEEDKKEEKLEDIKKIQVSESINMMGGDPNVKTVTINPNYVVSDA